MSFKKEFMRQSTDFLRLLGRKIQRANNNKSVEEEAEVMEVFYDAVEDILNRCDLALHEKEIRIVNVSCQLKLMHSEMIDTMKLVHGISVDMKPIPTEVQLNKIREKHQNGGVTIMKTLEFFTLSDKEINYILNG